MKKYALLSVSDKSGIADFAKSLVQEHGYQILATGNTATILKKEGLPVQEISKYTGFPELMDGRVKTVHPKIYAGILCRRDVQSHVQSVEEMEIRLIDLVVVNLYPFEQTIAAVGCTLEKAIENIDIGGPTLLRSAAKSHADVTVVCDPADYSEVLESLGDSQKLQSLRKKLAVKVFEKTANYDRKISEYLLQQGDEPNLNAMFGFADSLTVHAPLAKCLRYGENPHQKGALYGQFFDYFEQIHGKELSYNNILDITAATYLIGEFEKPTVGILKHTNPCGVATADTVEEAWEQAFAADKQAPFGGIIVLNRTVDAGFAAKVVDLFSEVIIAPFFTEEALGILSKKKNLRLMVSSGKMGADSLQEVRSVLGGFLVQDRDQKRFNPASWKVVTERKPTQEELNALLFGFRVVKHVKSNAIVFASNERTLGIGAGQMSRVDSTEFAIQKAQNAGFSLENAVIASDAFFPFPDGLELAAKVGITAVVQPGGSIRDSSVIEVANHYKMVMLFTESRHFKH